MQLTLWGRISPRRIQPEEAVAEVRDALAGHGQVLLRYLVKHASTLHHHAALAQHRKVLGDQIGTAPGALGNLRNHQWLARAQFA